MRALESAGRMLPSRSRGVAPALTANSPTVPSSQPKREVLYAAAVDASSLAFLTTDLNGIITSWNPGAERLFGYSAEEAIGRDIEVMVPADRRDEIAMIRGKFRAGQRIENFATVRLAKGDRPVHVVVDITPLVTPAHELIGASEIARDVTEQRLAEELFGLAVEACPSGMMMVDGGGRMVMVNSEIEHQFGYGRAELLGHPVEMLVPQSLRAAHEKLRGGFAERPESRVIGRGRELLGLCKDGKEIPIEVELNPARVRDGMTLAVIIDISERKLAERQKDEFVSTVSHELRTPLTSITASLALLAAGRAGQLPPPALRLIAIAHNNGQRLVRLVNDILDIEKIESGKVIFNFKQVAARAVVEQVIEASRAYAEQFDLKVRLDPDSVAGEIRADSDRLAQVITNLLANAIKFSPPGEDVVLAVVEREHRVRITVRDHGPGIPDDFKPRVFSKFAQADAGDARQKGGTGLGLSIVKQIVVRLGGEVGFDSVAGRGSLFYVEFPSWTGQEVEERTPAVGRGMKILLCEDDADVAAALSANLAKAGFSVFLASTVNDALRQADGVTFAAVLVDLRLPDGEGVGLIQQLRNMPRYRHTPIIAVSGDLTKGRTELRASALDILDWLDKPIDLGRLVRVLERPDVRAGSDNLRILYVEGDPSVRATVEGAMRHSADVISVDSIDDARRILASQSFDLAMLDVTTSAESGPDLLVELRNRDGSLIPVILLSAQSAHMAYASRVREALAKSSGSVDSLIAILVKRLGIQVPHGQSVWHDGGGSSGRESRASETNGKTQEVA